MAGCTFDFLGVGVGPAKSEIRFFVVERLVVDRGDVFSPTFVFRMTFFAGPVRFEPAVKSLPLFDIFPNGFVAIEAKACLSGLIEALVALGAIFFPLGMARDHLAWHQSRFDIVGPGGAYAEHPQCEQYE